MTTRPGADVPDRGDEIVVAVDGSAASRAALSWAVRHARSRGQQVVAVSVFDPAYLYAPPAPVFDSVAAGRAAAFEGLREAVVETVGPAVDAGVTEELLQGEPAAELVRRAEGVAMLVMGSHGRTRIGATVLGSVVAACLRRAECPVLVVGPKAVGNVLTGIGVARGAEASS